MIEIFFVAYVAVMWAWVGWELSHEYDNIGID